MSVVSPEDFQRLETKVDRLGDAVVMLARIEERQVAEKLAAERMLRRIEGLEGDLRATSTRLDTWINRGVGAWAVVGGAGTVFGLLHLFKGL